MDLTLLEEPSPTLPSPASFHDRQRTGLTAKDLREGVTEHLFFTIGRSLATATQQDLFLALCHTVRDRLMSRYLASEDQVRNSGARSVAYFSAEFLIGPQLANNLLMLGIRAEAEQAMRDFGITDLEQLLALEEEPGLGNGGLGRLAACYMESLASLEIPARGYGIRYEFGIFDQRIQDGWQVEIPDQWLKGGWPWELVRAERSCQVGFGGECQSYHDQRGTYRVRWTPAEQVLGIPHDVPVIGYRVTACSQLRLWRAAASEDLDLAAFNSGDYEMAVEQKVRSETLSKVLYPNDGTAAGRRLRLMQQYFFVSCSLQDMLRSVEWRDGQQPSFNDRWAIQLNDTHPAIAVAELMRLLIDEQGLGWQEAWQITQQSIAYTNHTLLPEALECWDLGLFGSVLPRHLQIIYEINSRFLQQVRLRYPHDQARLRRMSIIREDGGRSVRMAHLAVIAAHHVNGVAALHSRLLRSQLFADFAELWPQKFINVTNGVTPRRWLALANPPLQKLLSEQLGPEWLSQPETWLELERWAEDGSFRERWRSCRLQAKQRLAATIVSATDISVDAHSLFDVQVKRIHEYKRQHLNALHVISRYLRIKHGEISDPIPRTVIFAGKAAPGYWMAKLIIRLIHGIANVINNDADTRSLLQVVFLPDYNVKLSEVIYPAADLSEQISTAGMEASGTGNMKMAINGALTIGTLDGANIEILERVGNENFFLFGLTAEQWRQRISQGYRPWEWLSDQPLMQEAITLIRSGFFSNGDRELFNPLVDQLLSSDPFALVADFGSYLQAQQSVDQAWMQPDLWCRMSIQTLARCGYFSSDRAIREYARQIWDIDPLPVPMSATPQPVLP